MDLSRFILDPVIRNQYLDPATGIPIEIPEDKLVSDFLDAKGNLLYDSEAKHLKRFIYQHPDAPDVFLSQVPGQPLTNTKPYYAFPDDIVQDDREDYLDEINLNSYKFREPSFKEEGPLKYWTNYKRPALKYLLRSQDVNLQQTQPYDLQDATRFPDLLLPFFQEGRNIYYNLHAARKPTFETLLQAYQDVFGAAAPAIPPAIAPAIAPVAPIPAAAPAAPVAAPAAAPAVAVRGGPRAISEESLFEGL